MSTTVETATTITITADGASWASASTPVRLWTSAEETKLNQGPGGFNFHDPTYVTWFKFKPAHWYPNPDASPWGTAFSLTGSVTTNHSSGKGASFGVFRSTLPHPTTDQIEFVSGWYYGVTIRFDPGYYYFIVGTTFNASDTFQLSVTGGQSGDYQDTPPPPPPTRPKLSTLVDGFSTLSPAKWETLGPASIVGGALQLGDATVEGAVRSVNTYDFNRAQLKLNAAGNGMSLAIDDTTSLDVLQLTIYPDVWLVQAEWNLGGTFTSGESVEYDPDVHKYLKIERTPLNTVDFLTSTDGLDWSILQAWPLPSADSFRSVKAIIYGNLATSVDNFNVLEVGPIPDESNPGAGAPPSGDSTQPTCDTLMAFIREFSARVKQPIRITGPSTIEMVDVNTPLPTGFEVADADEMYHATTHELSAGERVLSTDAGNLALNVSADLVTNDVRLITSSWRLPHQLPVFGLVAGLVKRVSYALSPTTFTGSLEFQMRPVPLTVRRQ